MGILITVLNQDSLFCVSWTLQLGSTWLTFGTRSFSRLCFPLQLVRPQCSWDDLADRHSDTEWNCRDIIISVTQTHRNIFSVWDPFICSQTEERLHSLPQHVFDLLFIKIWVKYIKIAAGVQDVCVAKVTILSDQLVACSVFAPPFSFDSAHLEPRRRRVESSWAEIRLLEL